MAYQMAAYSTVNYVQEEKRIQHYSSGQQILLVGEGDFSFSLCLAHAFGSARNIVASSLQSYDEVIKMFKNGKSNLEKLKDLGGTILHGVDATKMEHHPYLKYRKFDRIVFNFPHAGFYGSEDNASAIQRHQNLVVRFFESARERLRPNGEIHVTHKMSPNTYDRWDVEGLASKTSLTCIERAAFNIENYPGYNNKRGAYPNCDENFPLGKCCTFKFILDPSQNMQITSYLHVPPLEFQDIPNSLSPQIHPFQHQLNSIDRRNSPTFINGMTSFPSYAGLHPRHDPTSKFFRLFNEYFNYIQEKFGIEDDIAAEDSVHLALRMYMAEPERPSEEFLVYVEMLHFWSMLRLTRLQQILQDLDRRLCEPQDMGITYELCGEY